MLSATNTIRSCLVTLGLIPADTDTLWPTTHCSDKSTPPPSLNNNNINNNNNNNNMQVLHTDNMKRKISISEKSSHMTWFFLLHPKANILWKVLIPNILKFLIFWFQGKVFLSQSVFLSMRKGGWRCQLGPSCYVPKCIVL